MFQVYLCRGMKISFVSLVNDLFMKHNIPLALLATVKMLDEWINDEFMIIPKFLNCAQIEWVHIHTLCIVQVLNLQGLY